MCVPGIEFRVSGLVAKTLTAALSPWPAAVLNETRSPVSQASLEPRYLGEGGLELPFFLPNAEIKACLASGS